MSERAPKQISFTVPLVPPSVNHYVKHTRDGRHYVSAEAQKFKADMQHFVGYQHVVGKYFQVEATIYLGAKQKGDVDGFAKVLLDSLADLRVFRTVKKGIPQAVSDAHVYELHLRKLRDEQNPRTEITVRSIWMSDRAEMKRYDARPNDNHVRGVEIYSHMVWDCEAKEAVAYTDSEDTAINYAAQMNEKGFIEP